MRKSDREINLLDISQTEKRSYKSDKVKTTDININPSQLKDPM